jgi:hypothetical protein
MDDVSTGTRRFTLHEANALLPTVRQLTKDAVHDAESLTRKMQKLSRDDAHYDELDASLNARITQWASDIQALGVAVKGLWLVDFDNGEGYYCWQHPEPTITHYHGYTEGFAGRMKIV